MKRLLSFLIVLSFLVLTLTGCQQGQQTNSSTPVEGTQKPVSSVEQSSVTSQSQTTGSSVKDTGSQSSPQKSEPKAEEPNGIPPAKVVEITPEVPDQYYIYKDGMGYFTYNSKCGYLDRDGKVVIEPKYTDGTLFSEGYAAAQTTDGSFVIIDKKGSEVFKTDKYRLIDNSPYNEFHENAIMVSSKDGKKYVLIDTSGKELFSVVPDSNAPNGVLSCGVIVLAVRNGKEIMVIDSQGNEVAPSVKTGFDSDDIPALNYTDNLLAVSNPDKTWNVIDKTGKKVFQQDFEQLKQPSEGLIPFKKYNKWGYLDYKGNVVIEPKYEDAYSFSNGLAAVKVNGKIGFIDSKNNMKIEPRFSANNQISTTTLFEFDENGFAIVGDNNGSVINLRGDIVLPGPFRAYVHYEGDGMISYYNGGSSKLYRLK